MWKCKGPQWSSAVAAKYLARKDAGSIAIIGAGAQGRMQLRALRWAFDVDDICITDCFPEAARAFAKEMSAELGVAVRPVSDVRTADEEVIVAGLVGLGTHDVACAAHVVETALQEGRGSFFDFQQAGG